tara:strand:- start:345 stop:659 length:315 start_codon:yes stop_codon:yes gene_type:complete
MEKSIRVAINDAVVATYIMDDGKEIVGQIKVEIFAEYVLVHPHLFKVNKTTCKAAQELFKKVCEDMKAREYNAVHATTDNAAMVRMITQGKAKEIMPSIYEYGV